MSERQPRKDPIQELFEGTTTSSKKCLVCSEIDLTAEELEMGGTCFFCKYQEIQKAREIFERDDIDFPVPEEYGRRTENLEADYRGATDIDSGEELGAKEEILDPSTVKRKYTWDERKKMYEQFGWDPESVHIDPITIRVRGATEDVYLELQLPRISTDALRPEFTKLLERTLSFICNVNTFAPQHPDSLLQLRGIIDPSGNNNMPMG